MADRSKKKKKQWQYKAARKQKDKTAVLNPHLSIITLSINGLDSPIKIHRVAGWIKKQDLNIYCPRRPISALKTNMGWSEWMENDTPSKWQPPQKSERSHIHNRQNRLQTKNGNKRQRWIFFNDKGGNPSRRHNSY